MKPGERGRQFKNAYLIVLVVAVIGVVGVTVLEHVYPDPRIELYGQLNLYSNVAVSPGHASCWGTGEYADLRERKTVTILEGAGRELVGVLEGYPASDTECDFPFHAALTPGRGTYTFDAGHGSARTYTEAQLRAKPTVVLVIGR